MATSKADDGKPGVVRYTVIAVNRANQPREWKIRGRWIRWEPAGRPKDSQALTAEEVASADFKSVAKYFSTKPAPAEEKKE